MYPCRTAIGLVGLGLLAVACSRPSPDETPAAASPAPAQPAESVPRDVTPKSADPPPDDPTWPVQPNPRWPRNCLIEDLGVHPHQPWLTLACSDPEGKVDGALLVIDVQSGSLLSVSPADGNAGWYGDGGLVLWNAKGDRLASNVWTNSIGLFERGAAVSVNSPDETRDNPVDYAWVDHRIYTDTGHFFDPKNEETGGRFGFEPVEGIVWSIDTFKWVPKLGAVVGAAYPDKYRDPDLQLDPNAVQLVAYAPQRQKVVYRESIAPYILELRWSANRRWAVGQRKLDYPRSAKESVLDVYDTHSGKLSRQVSVPGSQLRKIAVRDDGLLVTASYSTVDASAKVKTEVFAPDGSHSVLSESMPWPDGAALGSNGALSLRGTGFAQLLRDESIALFDLTTGKHQHTFPAPVPPPPGRADQPSYASVLWISDTRLATVGPHFVRIWSVDGTRVASFDVAAN